MKGGVIVFYDIFERLCQENGITPSQVRNDLNISQSTMASWKSRGLTPSAKTLNEMAGYFDVSIGDLLGEPQLALYEDDDSEIQKSVQVPKKYSIRIDTSKTVDLAPIFKRADNGTLTDEDRKILEEQRKKLPEAMERFAATWKKIDDILSREDTDNAET